MDFLDDTKGVLATIVPSGLQTRCFFDVSPAIRGNDDQDERTENRIAVYPASVHRG
jgi:hypothetical protein